MKIDFERSGGITGMVTNFSADTNSLSPDEAHQIHELINNARFFDIPSESGSPQKKGAADYFEYIITVEKEGGQTHTIKTTDITMPPALRPVINFLARKQRAMSAK
jgi:hypothetical protein